MNASSSISAPTDEVAIDSMPRQQSRRRRRPPRKFVIKSTFGNPRRPRSRKNRPCDACRKRKTACVIATDPPSNDAQAIQRPAILQDGAQEDEPETVQQQQLQPPTSNRGSSFNVTAPPITNRVLPSPGRQEAVPYYLSPALYDQPDSFLPQCSDPAILVHQNFVHSPVTSSTADTEAVRTILLRDQAILNNTTNTLEDIPGRCAYFLGRPSEQDGFLLDSFKYGILRDNFSLSANIAQVQSYSTSSSLTEQSPIHFLLLRIEHLDHVKRDKQQVSDAIESKVWPFGDHLVRLFFRHVHPAFPIVSKVRFLSRYHADKKSIPACLRGAIYALASVFWDRDYTLKDTSMPFVQHELTDYAHQVLRREMENPNLFILQACLLLQHVTPPAMDTLEAPTTWTSSAQATACAQMIGLHVEPGDWNINATERHLRRKLWWATFYADCWSAMCHGNPSHIASKSYTTTPLTMEDMRWDEDVPDDVQYLVEREDRRFQVSTGARFLEMVDVARSLRTVLDCSYQVNDNSQARGNNLAQAETDILAVEARLKEWASLIPSCLDLKKEAQDRRSVASYNCPLHLSFYTTQVLLYRALMHPSTREAKLKASSNLRKWFPEALLAFDGFVQFISHLDKSNMVGFWGRYARSQFVLCGNFLVFLFLVASERGDIEHAYSLLETFHQAMNGLWDVSNEEVTALLRAAKDRIDSFFSQAAQVIRRGTTDGGVTIL
ncbi:Transcriptional activator protein [Trichoderma lentiforme]|uniref:Transcriptional activator protein n=1 Tax=Trichoderma lentiforme TaxID=1567552 RepID=A0A9P4X3D4_9HYPO|nr:Transcriptional activator protein [Trichoderma lentiforme]